MKQIDDLELLKKKNLKKELSTLLSKFPSEIKKIIYLSSLLALIERKKEIFGNEISITLSEVFDFTFRNLAENTDKLTNYDKCLFNFMINDGYAKIEIKDVLEADFNTNSIKTEVNFINNLYDRNQIEHFPQVSKDWKFEKYIKIGEISSHEIIRQFHWFYYQIYDRFELNVKSISPNIHFDKLNELFNEFFKFVSPKLTNQENEVLQFIDLLRQNNLKPLVRNSTIITSLTNNDNKILFCYLLRFAVTNNIIFSKYYKVAKHIQSNLKLKNLGLDTLQNCIGQTKDMYDFNDPKPQIKTDITKLDIALFESNCESDLFKKFLQELRKSIKN